MRRFFLYACHDGMVWMTKEVSREIAIMWYLTCEYETSDMTYDYAVETLGTCENGATFSIGNWDEGLYNWDGEKLIVLIV
jgi:hypothetical protein